MTAHDEGNGDGRLAAFAGQVSHDLKNPLSAIRLSLELARDEVGADGDPDLLSLLRRAERAAERMDVTINDLLAYAQIEVAVDRTGRVELGVALVEVVEDLGDEVAPGQVRVVADLPTVRGHGPGLRLVLAHLIANAVKFSPWNAPVEVAADRTEAGWRVTVADHGPGVPLLERERVFEPMVRLEKAVPGTGLGLATCRRIVEGHGGRIGIDDRTGGGAAVWFELPG